jgi:glycerol 3-phosphatase-2
VTGNVILDIDGVILLGGDAIPGSGEAMALLERSGFNLVVATNNATRTPEAAAARIAERTGFAVDPASLVTSTIALAGMLLPGDEPVLAVAEPGMAATLRANGVAVTDDPSEAATVAVGLDRSFSYEKLHRAAEAVRRGARFIASNTDATFPTPHGPAPGAGAIVAAVERAAGRTAEVAGKPHAPMRRAVAACLKDGPVWMVGDRPETDLAFAVAAGWVPVLALSGVVRDAGGVPAELTPAMVIDRLADLPARLAQRP